MQRVSLTDIAWPLLEIFTAIATFPGVNILRRLKLGFVNTHVICGRRDAYSKKLHSVRLSIENKNAQDPTTVLYIRSQPSP